MTRKRSENRWGNTVWRIFRCHGRSLDSDLGRSGDGESFFLDCARILVHTSKVECKSYARGSNPSKELLKISSRPFFKHWLGGKKYKSDPMEAIECVHPVNTINACILCNVKPDRCSNLMLIRTWPIAHCFRLMFTAKQQDQQRPRQPPQDCPQLAGRQALQHLWRQGFRWPTMSPLQSLSLAQSRSRKEQYRPLQM